MSISGISKNSVPLWAVNSDQILLADGVVVCRQPDSRMPWHLESIKLMGQLALLPLASSVVYLPLPSSS